jgi:starch phosphorylase
VGAENFFLFGLTAAEVTARRAEVGYARAAIEASPRLTRALKQIAGGTFSGADKDRYKGLVSGLYDHDYFLVTCDFDSYFDAQRKVDTAFRDRSAWTKMAALNTARVGWFSSDRTISGYASDIWNARSLIGSGTQRRNVA